MVRTALVAVIAGCATTPAAPRAPQRRAGELMIEVGARFARANVEAPAGHWELAAYDLHELRETLEDDVLPGKWRDNPSMHAEAERFLAGPFATLEATARTRDAAGWRAAFAATVTACNHCHETGRVPFLKIDEHGALEH